MTRSPVVIGTALAAGATLLSGCRHKAVTFDDLFVDGDRMCAVAKDRRVYCAYDERAPSVADDVTPRMSAEEPGAVRIGKGFTCALSQDGTVACALEGGPQRAVYGLFGIKRLVVHERYVLALSGRGDVHVWMPADKGSVPARWFVRDGR
jgi:hypothetical protein